MSITEILNSRSRTQEVSTARMAIAYHLRMEGLSLNQVGAKIKRDHSTVHYLVEKCRDLISVRDRRTIEAVENFQQVLHDINS